MKFSVGDPVRVVEAPSLVTSVRRFLGDVGVIVVVRPGQFTPVPYQVEFAGRTEFAGGCRERFYEEELELLDSVETIRELPAFRVGDPVFVVPRQEVGVIEEDDGENRFPLRVMKGADRHEEWCDADELELLDSVETISLIPETAENDWAEGDRFIYSGPEGQGITPGQAYTVDRAFSHFGNPAIQFIDDTGRPHIFTTHRQYCTPINEAPVTGGAERPLLVGDKVTVVCDQCVRYGETGAVYLIEEDVETLPVVVEFEDGDVEPFERDELDLFVNPEAYAMPTDDEPDAVLTEDELDAVLTEDDTYVSAYATPEDDVPPPVSDAVYQPAHYARYVIEPVTFINANKLPYNIGNVIKYTCRYDAKNGIEDLRKAIRYLEIQIETIDRETRIANGEDARDVWKTAL